MELPVNYNGTHFSIRKLVREEYVRLQGGKCCHCNNDLTVNASQEMMSKKIKISLFPDSFFKWPVHLHHDRRTGLTIGAVHNQCNAVLWQYHGE